MNQLEINKVQNKIEKKKILEEQKRKKNYEENQKQILQIKDKISENQRIYEDNISKLEMERIKEEQNHLMALNAERNRHLQEIKNLDEIKNMYEQQNLEFMKQIEEECRKNKEI